MMDEGKRRRLTEAGWCAGDPSELLGLTPAESQLVDLRIALGRYLRDLRHEREWTQAQVAQHLGSSQSRVAKMEAADPSVTLDLLVRALLSLGASGHDVGRVIQGAA